MTSASTFTTHFTSYRTFLLFFILCLSLSSFCLASKSEEEKLSLVGVGAGPVRLLFLDWAYLFAADHYSLDFQFFRANLTTSFPFLANGSISFIQSWLSLTEKEQKTYPTLRQFPYLVVPSTFSYNIPGLGVTSVSGHESVILSVELLAEIYIGEVKMWNDPRILKLNPHIVDLLPAQNITCFGFPNPAQSTLYQVQGFYRYSPKFRKLFPQGPFDVWPLGMNLINPNFKTVDGTFSTMASIQNTKYSIGLTSLPAYLLASLGTFPTVRLHHHGKIVELNTQSGLEFLNRGRTSDKGALEFPNGEIKYKMQDDLFAGWPFVGMSYIMLRGEYEKKDCEQYQKVLRFIRWGLIARDPRKAASETGYYALPKEYQERSLQLLEELQCGGESLLALQVVDDHDSSYFEALLAINWVLATLILIPGIIMFLWLSRDAKGTKVPWIAKLYSGVLLLGALIVYTAVVFFYLVPDSKWVCQLRQWSTALGLTIFLGAMFTRTLQIHRIHRMARSKKVPSNRSATAMKRRALLDFFYGIGITTPIQIILLILWTTIQPLEPELKIIDDIAREASWVCNCKDIWLWFGLEMGFFLCLLCYGVMVVYRTWDLKTNGFNESKWLLMAIYNLLLTVAALVPLFATLEIWDDKIFIIAAIGLDFAVSSTLCCLYIQRAGAWIETLVWRWRTRSDTSGKSSTTSPSGTTSGSMVATTNTGAARSAIASTSQSQSAQDSSHSPF